MNELFIEGIGDNVILLKFRQNGKYETPIAVAPDTFHRFAQTLWETSQALKNNQ